VSDAARESVNHLDQGYDIDDETEDERLFFESPDAYHEREMDKQPVPHDQGK
jgi:hypothetical protein